MTGIRAQWARRNRQTRLVGSRHRATWGIVIVALLVLAGCAQSTTPASSHTQGHNTSSSALPHFSDWRAVYLAPDGRAHIVSLDGKSDLAGPALPDLTSNGLVVSSAGVGPNGKLLAYGATALDLVDLTGRTPPRTVSVYGGVNNLIWSPDGTKLYSYLGGGQFSLVSLPTGQATNVTPGQGVVGEVGWIDTTHLAAVSDQGASFVTDSSGDRFATSTELASVDVTTDQVRTIATFQGVGPTAFDFAVSPSGTQALYFDAPFRAFPFTPQVALVNLTTGNVTPLPTIAQTTGASFSAIAWRPGTDTLAVSTGFTENGDLKTWLIDVGADTASKIAPTGYPLGWAPDNGPLILSSGWQSSIGLGPYTLSAVTCASGVQCSGATLTEHAMTFAFLGFVRNP